MLSKLGLFGFRLFNGFSRKAATKGASQWESYKNASGFGDPSYKRFKCPIVIKVRHKDLKGHRPCTAKTDVVNRVRRCEPETRGNTHVTWYAHPRTPA